MASMNSRRIAAKRRSTIRRPASSSASKKVDQHNFRRTLPGQAISGKKPLRSIDSVKVVFVNQTTKELQFSRPATSTFHLSTRPQSDAFTVHTTPQINTHTHSVGSTHQHPKPVPDTRIFSKATTLTRCPVVSYPRRFSLSSL